MLLIKNYDKLPYEYREELKKLKQEIEECVNVNFYIYKIYCHQKMKKMTVVIVFNMDGGTYNAVVNYYEVIKKRNAREELRSVGWVYPIDIININKYKHICNIEYRINILQKDIYSYDKFTRVDDYTRSNIKASAKYISKFKHDVAKVILDTVDTLAKKYDYISLQYVKLENIESSINIKILYRNKDTNKHILRIYSKYIVPKAYPAFEENLEEFLCNSTYYNKYIELVEIW